MSEFFILQLAWIILCLVIALFGMYLTIKLILHNALLKSSTILQNKMASFRRDFPIVAGTKPENILGQSIENLGINGILNELGVDPSILNNPIVKGLISKYAPKIIEQMSKTGKVEQTPNYGLDSL